MTDIASLGIAVDSKPVQGATKSLADLAKQAGTTEGVINAMAKRSGVSFEDMANRIIAKNRQVQASFGGLSGMSQAQSPLRAVTTQLTGIINPLNLATLAFSGLGTAAGIALSKILDQAPDANEVLERHDHLVRIVKASYDRATGSVKNFFEQSREVTTLQLLQQQLDLRQQLRDEAGKVISGSTTFGTIGDFFASTKQVRQELAPFEDAIFRLKDGFDKGQPSVKAFMDEVAKIGLANPQFQKLSAELISVASQGQNVENRLLNIAEMLKLVRGQAVSPQGLARLGLPEPRETKEALDVYERAVEAITKRIERSQIEIATYNMTAEAAARYRIEKELENAARRNGEPLTATEIQQKEMLASQYGRLTGQLEAMTRAQEQLEGTRSILQGIAMDAARGADSATLLANALSRVGDRLIDSGFDILFGNGRRGGGLFQSMFSGGGSNPVSSYMMGDYRVPVLHDGGIVGQRASAYRNIHPAYFDDAPRYHNGGIAGLAPDEVPAILQRGERIIPRGEAGGMTVNVPISISADSEGQSAVKAIRGYVQGSEFEHRVVSAVQKAQKSRVKV